MSTQERVAAIPVKPPREDGAWWMAATCWLCGAAAPLKPPWPALIPAGVVVGALLAAQSLRAWRRLRAADPAAGRRWLASLILLLVATAVLAAGFSLRVPQPAWLAALGLPGLVYAGIILAGAERHPLSRVLAVVALTAAAPAAFGAVQGALDEVAAVLWLALGGYYLLGSLFVVARFRASVPLLRVVRTAAPAAFLAALPGGPLLAAAFLILGLRAWLYRAPERPPSARRVGWIELRYGFLTALLVLAGLWWR